MKVLMINGSPHKNGNTYTALREICSVLERDGIYSDIIHIGTRPVRSCIACGQCRLAGTNRCIFDDDICNQVAREMERADALVVGSPVYYGQPNGAVVSLIQRLFFSAGALCQGKPAAAVAVCRRGGATSAFQTMCMPFMMMNMTVVGSQYWNIAYGREPGQAALDTEGMQTMRTLGRNLAWLLKKTHVGARHLPPEPEPWLPMNFIR